MTRRPAFPTSVNIQEAKNAILGKRMRALTRVEGYDLKLHNLDNVYGPLYREIMEVVIPNFLNKNTRIRKDTEGLKYKVIPFRIRQLTAMVNLLADRKYHGHALPVKMEDINTLLRDDWTRTSEGFVQYI